MIRAKKARKLSQEARQVHCWNEARWVRDQIKIEAAKGNTNIFIKIMYGETLQELSEAGYHIKVMDTNQFLVSWEKSKKARDET